MATKTTKKVGTNKANAGDKKKAGRAEFKVPKDKLDVAVPEGYDFKSHKPLKRTDFQESYLFTMHQAARADFQSTVYADKAVALREKAEKDRVLGDDKTRKAAKRAQKLTSQLSELTKLLADQGVDVDALLKGEAGDE